MSPSSRVPPSALIAQALVEPVSCGEAGVRPEEDRAAPFVPGVLLGLPHEHVAETAAALVGADIEPVQFRRPRLRKVDGHAGADPPALVLDDPERAALAR